MLRTLLPLAAVTLIACSGSNFELPSGGTDTGAVSSDEDTGTPGSEDGGTSSEDANTGSRDGAAVDSGPGCNTALPPLACSAPSPDPAAYAPQIQYGAGSVIGVVDHNTSHAISYVTDRAGRHEKLILTVRRKTLTGGTAGQLTLTAYYTPCAGVHVPLGKSRSFDAGGIVDGNQSFYFADPATHLPLFPAGTRLTFVLSTDSTAYSFELIGSESGATPPPSLKYWIKRGTGAWEPPGSPALPSTQAWIRNCPTG